MPRKSSLDIAFPASPTSRITAPDDLEEPARSMFASIVANVRADFFQPVHAPLVASFARALIAEREAHAKLTHEPVTSDGKTSAWLTVWKTEHNAMMTLARSLRLTPSSQYLSPTPSAERAPVPSYYERMSLEGLTDDAERN